MRSLGVVPFALFASACGVGPEPGPQPLPGVLIGSETPADACSALGVAGEVPPALDAASGVLVDSFDDGARTAPVCARSVPDGLTPFANSLGYCSECFNDCAGAQGGRLDVSLTTDPASAFRCTGRSLSLEYDLDQDVAACDVPGAGRYAGYVELLVANDLCPTDRGAFNLEALDVAFLSFWVLAVESTTDWDLEVALKDVENRQSDKVLIRESGYLEHDAQAGGWQQVKIPTSVLESGNPAPELRQLREINITVNAARMGQLSGTLLLDEIALLR